ncbi:MAG: adenosine kinase [Opitutales bacterium]
MTEKTPMTFIGVGSPIVDSIAMVEESFLDQVEGEKGGMVLVDGPSIDAWIAQLPEGHSAAPGGSAGNTLFALARMGAAAKFLGKSGNCARGRFYRERFAELGGDSSRFKKAEQPNGHCLSLVTPDGERTMRTDLGAAMTLAPDEISVADFEGCTHAHIEGYLLFNEALMQRILECAKAAGCRISLDLASFEVVHAAKASLSAILENYVDLVFANEEEGEAYTGIKGDESAMARELGRLCQIAVVKVGPHGSYIASDGVVQKIEPEPVDHVVDTTGAGDLWAAGFLYGLSKDRELADCARIGSLLGAAVVQQRGSVLPDPIWEQILERVS